MPKDNKEGTPVSVVLVAVGMLLAGVGWMLAFASGQASAEWVSLGNGLLAVGGILLGLGILIEFFSIGSNLRRIVRSMTETARDTRNEPPINDAP